MTFIIGWKFNNVGYICADSAITGAADYASHGYTSFGELNDLCTHHSVQEAALKIIRLDNIAIAYAGSVEPALSCIRMIKNNVDNGDEVSVSFEKSVNSHIPLRQGAEYKLIAVCSEPSYVKLLTFNLNGDQKTIEHENECVFAGSLPYADAHQVAKQLVAVLSINHKNPQDMLAIALSLLQNMGIHDYLLKSGVGGVFSGVYADNEKVYRQPSIMYCIVKSEEVVDMVTAGIYGKALATYSTTTSYNKIFSDGVTANSEHLQKSDIREKILIAYEAARYDYIVLLGQRYKSVVVLEMRKSLEAKSCTIAPKKHEGEHVQINVGPSQQAVDYVQGKQKRDGNYILGTYLYFFEYGPKE